VSSIEPRWATLAAAAAYLTVNERTIRRWLSDGTIPGKRIGPKLIRVDLNDLDRLGRSLLCVERVVESAPPLTADQRARISGLLVSTSARGDV
jgi:excisionase family DNA binding protein